MHSGPAFFAWQMKWYIDMMLAYTPIKLAHITRVQLVLRLNEQYSYKTCFNQHEVNTARREVRPLVRGSQYLGTVPCTAHANKQISTTLCQAPRKCSRMTGWVVLLCTSPSGHTDTTMHAKCCCTVVWGLRDHTMGDLQCSCPQRMLLAWWFLHGQPLSEPGSVSAAHCKHSPALRGRCFPMPVLKHTVSNNNHGPLNTAMSPRFAGIKPWKAPNQTVQH